MPFDEDTVQETVNDSFVNDDDEGHHIEDHNRQPTQHDYIINRDRGGRRSAVFFGLVTLLVSVFVVFVFGSITSARTKNPTTQTQQQQQKNLPPVPAPSLPDVRPPTNVPPQNPPVLPPTRDPGTPGNNANAQGSFSYNVRMLKSKEKRGMEGYVDDTKSVGVSAVFTNRRNLVRKKRKPDEEAAHV